MSLLNFQATMTRSLQSYPAIILQRLQNFLIITGENTTEFRKIIFHLIKIIMWKITMVFLRSIFHLIKTIM